MVQENHLPYSVELAMSQSALSFAYGLSLLKIPVTEINRSVAFFRDFLGLKEEFVADEYGWAQLSAGNLSLALYVPGKGGGEGTVGGSVGFHLTLAAPEFDALSSDLLARGVLGEGRVHQGNDGTTFIDVVDPDGNVLKILRI